MSDFQPGDFLKCPDCKRANTVEMTIHLDNDISFECQACGAHAMAYPLHEHARVYDSEGQYSK